MEARTRRTIRQTHADLLAARERAAAVTRPDGTDEGGHPGIEAANLEGVLGRFAVPLLDELERMEAAFEEATTFDDIHVAGVPASLAAFAAVTIEGLPGASVPLPLKLRPHAGEVALVLDVRPAMDAVIKMRDEMRGTAEPESAEEKSEPSELHEGCARRGGVCDCGGRPCALDVGQDVPEPPPSSPGRAA